MALLRRFTGGLIAPFSYPDPQGGSSPLTATCLGLPVDFIAGLTESEAYEEWPLQVTFTATTTLTLTQMSALGTGLGILEVTRAGVSVWSPATGITAPVTLNSGQTFVVYATVQALAAARLQATLTVSGASTVVDFPVVSDSPSAYGEVVPMIPVYDAYLTTALSFLTSINIGRDQVETRAGLRNLPRRLLKYEYMVGTSDMPKAAAMEKLARVSGNEVLVPIWPEARALGAAAPAGAVTLSVAEASRSSLRSGGLLMVYLSDTEYRVGRASVVGVSSITLESGLTKAIPAGAAVVPLLPCTPANQVSYRSPVNGIETVTVTWLTSPSDDTHWVPAVSDFRAGGSVPNSESALRYLITPDINWRDDVTGEYNDTCGRVDFEVGAVTVVPRNDLYHLRQYTYTHTAIGTSEVDNLLAWLYHARGRLTTYMMVRGDIPVVAVSSVSSYATFIYLNCTSISNNSLLKIPVKGVRLTTTAGATHLIGVEHAGLRTSDGAVVLRVVNTVTPFVPLTNISKIDLLVPVRLGQDDIELNWLSSSVVEATITLQELA